jgi:phage terminase large subunit
MIVEMPTPTEKQREFLLAKTRYVGYGGARGGGKSFAVRLKARLMALRYPGIRILLLRRTFPELRENHMRPLVADTAGYAKYRDNDKSLTFINGSLIKFGYCDNENDVNQYQGQEYDVLFFDEATHFTEYMYDRITACCRGANDFPKRIYITCNPGGVGHGWVKRLFIDKDYREGEKAEDYTFIRSSVYDNAPLLERDPDYLNTLKRLPDELRRAWLDGDWDAFAGQYFSEWRSDIHVIKPFDIPSHWTRVVALDYGLDMLAVVWGAFDTHGNGVVYKELCQSGLKVSDAASAIFDVCTDDELSIGSRHKLVVVAPPDMWNRQKDTGKSIAELFLDNGILFQRADNNRQAGWSNLKEWLSVYDGEDGDLTAHLRVFNNCSNLIRCMPLLQYDQKNSLDCATEPHDITHSPDALRYLIQSRPRAAVLKEDVSPENKWISDHKKSLLGGRNKSKVYR